MSSTTSPQGYGKIGRYLAGRPSAAGKLPGRHRHPREPRAQPVHRGRRAAARRGRLPRARARRADAGRRVSGRRREGARAVQRKLDPGKMMEDFVGGGRLSEGASRVHRQGRRRRLLLRRRHREPAGGALSGSRRGGAVLRPPADGGGRREDQGAAAHSLRRARRAHQRGLAGVRGGAEGESRHSTTDSSTTACNHGFHNDTTPRYDKAAASSRGTARSSSSTRRCAEGRRVARRLSRIVPAWRRRPRSAPGRNAMRRFA